MSTPMPALASTPIPNPAQPKPVTTERKIGKITYFVKSSPSETAKDTINQKIEKLILRDIERNATTT